MLTTQLGHFRLLIPFMSRSRRPHQHASHDARKNSSLLSSMFSVPPHCRQATILLNISLALGREGRCSTVSFFYGLPQEDVTKALLARGSSGRAAAENLMAKAQQGANTITRILFLADRRSAVIHALSVHDPSTNRQVNSLLQLSELWIVTHWSYNYNPRGIFATP